MSSHIYDFCKSSGRPASSPQVNGARVGDTGQGGLAFWAPGPRRVLPPRFGSQAGLESGLTPKDRASDRGRSGGRQHTGASPLSELRSPQPSRSPEAPLAPPRRPCPSAAPGRERFSRLLPSGAQAGRGASPLTPALGVPPQHNRRPQKGSRLDSQKTREKEGEGGREETEERGAE